MMRRSETICLCVGLVLLTYTGLGFIASYAVEVPLTLNQGAATRTIVPRLNAGVLRMEMEFKGRGRAELGDGNRGNGSPIAELELEIRQAGQEPKRYRAAAAGAFGAGYVMRPLVGVSQDQGAMALRAGLNRLEMTVISVDPRLQSETVEIEIIPAIGAKNYEPAVGWLLWVMFSPLYLPIYFLWCAVLLWLRRHRPTIPADRPPSSL